MVQINIHEAKTHLSRLLARVADGEEVVIASSGTPVARLVSWKEPAAPRALGRDEGLFAVPDGFDAPLPPDVLAEFEA